MTRASRYHAFTLAELMVVCAIVGIVVTASTTMVFQVDGARRRAERDADAWAEADAAINAIANALANAYRYGPDDDEVIFEGVSDEMDGFIADRVRFFTVSYIKTRQGEPESDVREVEFALHTDPYRPLPVLRRRLDPTFNPEPDGGGVIDELAENVVMLNITYFDGSLWYDDWLREFEAMPIAVRVTMQVARANNYESDTREPKRVTVSRLINFSRMPQAGQTGDESQGAAFNEQPTLNNPTGGVQ